MPRLIAFLSLIAAIWVIYDVWVNQKHKTSEAKLIWTIAAIFFSGITAIVYYVAEKRK